MKKIDKKTNNKKNIFSNYPIGDFLIRLKNAAIAGRKSFVAPSSNLVRRVAEVLEREKIIDEISDEDGQIKVKLTFRSKNPVLMDVILVSKPGLRIYMGVDEIKKKKGPTFMILSTPSGVMSGKEAIEKNTGGEVIAEIL